MTFREGAQTDSGRTGSSGNGAGSPAHGTGSAAGGRAPQERQADRRGLKLFLGGAGALAVLVLAVLFGVNPGGFVSGDDPGLTPGLAECNTGAGADGNVDCRVAATARSLDDVWTRVLPTAGVRYTPPTVTLFDGSVHTAGCGSATADVGPFYCASDGTAYVDTTFFAVLQREFGASGGPLAQEYVVAHEFGHHIQDLLGDAGRASAEDRGAGSAAVRSELQADCYAGVWAHFASTASAPGSDHPLLEPLTDADVADALSAAESVGDDHIQRGAGHAVDSDSWTHGSSSQRQKWFLAGYRSGRVDSCDTFAANAPA